MQDRRLVVLLAVGVVALLAGSGLAWAIWDRGEESTPTRAASAPGPSSSAPDSSGSTTAETVAGDRFVSRAGGFSVRVPAGMSRARDGDAARFTDRARGVAVTVGPTSGGPLRDVSRSLVRRLRAAYTEVRVSKPLRDRIDGRPTLSTYGTARNRAGTELRFAVVVVRARPRNYGLTTFAAAGSDPAEVLPRVTTITRSFRVID